MHLLHAGEAAEAASGYRFGRGHAWFAFAMTIGLMMVDYIDRQVIVSLFPHIKLEWGLSDTQLGSLVSIVSVIVALAGLPVALLADRWSRRTSRGRIYTSAIGMSLFLPALFGVGNAGTLGIAIMGLIIFGLGWGFFDCNNMPILCQIARPELRATGYGIMNLVSISCGGFGDWAFGALRDQHVPLNVIFGAFAGIALLSVGLVLLIRPRPHGAAPSASPP